MNNPKDNAISNLIKEIAVNAVNANKPTSMYYGTVLSVSPLQVQISSNLILTEEFLVVPKSLTDYELTVEIDWTSEDTNISHTHIVEFNDRYNTNGDTESKSIVSNTQISNVNHHHTLKGKKSLKIYNALKVGEKVILTQVQGGQEFIINDKVG